MRFMIFIVLAALGLSACVSGATQTPFAVTVPALDNGGAAVIATQPTPTSRPPTLTHTPSATPTPTATASPTVTPSPSFTPTYTFTPSITPTLAPVAFFQLARPIAPGGTDYVDRSYPFGSTALGNWPVHHGVEFQNPRGTPVLAAAGGTVYYAGSDAERVFGPRLDYYGNLVILAHDFTALDGRPVYSLYGHLDELDVETGQQVALGDRLGRVGDTGIAIGPHLHFEVRVGDPDSFSASHNPEMWLRPYATYGMIAGRVVDAQGAYLPEVIVHIKRAGRSSVFRTAYSYADDPRINRDSVWNENVTVGDIPEGRYDVIVSTRFGQVRFAQEVEVRAGAITWVEIKLDVKPDQIPSG